MNFHTKEFCENNECKEQILNDEDDCEQEAGKYDTIYISHDLCRRPPRKHIMSFEMKYKR